MGIKKQSQSDNENDTNLKEFTEEWSLYKRRWAVLGVFMLLNCSNTWMMISHGPIAYPVSDLYNITVMQVNALSMIVMILNVPGGFFAAWALDMFDRKLLLVIAAWINALGGVLRCLAVALPASLQYTCLVLGSVCIGGSQPLITWSPTPIAQGWFGNKERGLANSLLSLSNPVGLMVSIVISPLVTNGDPQKVQTVNYIALVPAATAMVMMSIGGFFTKSVPHTPPGPAAALTLATKTESSDTWRGLRSLFRIKSYWLLMACVGGGIGIFSAVILLMNQLLCPYGYSSTLTGPVLGPVIVLGGLVGAAVGSSIVDKNKKYFFAVRTSYVVAGGALALFVVSVLLEWHESVLIILALIFGVFGLPIYPIGNELAVELSYPVSPVSSAGFMFMVGGLCGALFSLIFLLLSFPYPAVDYPNQTCTSDLTGDILDGRVGMIVMTVMIFVLGLLSFFIKGDLKRVAAEKAGRISVNEESSAFEHVQSSMSVAESFARTIESTI